MRVTSLVRVLDADPCLGDELDPALLRRARHHLVAHTEHAAAGEWSPPRFGGEPFGLLVLEGMLIRRFAIAGRSSVELLREGDVVRPWQSDSDEHSVSPHATWHAPEPTTLAVLDREFVALAARWPEVMIALADRLVRRSRSLALRLALAQAPNLAARVLVVLWHLADRWGRVTPAGIVIPFRIPGAFSGS